MLFISATSKGKEARQMTKYFQNMDAAKMELIRLNFSDQGNGYWVSRTGVTYATVNATGHKTLRASVSFGMA